VVAAARFLTVLEDLNFNFNFKLVFDGECWSGSDILLIATVRGTEWNAIPLYLIVRLAKSWHAVAVCFE